MKKTTRSPSSRSLEALRKEWPLVAGVEKFVRFPPPGHSVDLFGFADILCCRGDWVLLVQVTSGNNHANRLDKVLFNPNADYWLQSPHRMIHVHSWRKAGERGKRKTWTLRETHVHRVDGRLIPIETA